MRRAITNPRRDRRNGRRRGVTTVEFAFVAPVLFLFVFAAVEISRANLVLHTCRIAAVNGARRGIFPGANADDCRRAALHELEMIGVNEATIQVEPNQIRPTDTEVSVTVQAPVTLSNGFATPNFLFGRTIQSSATLSRESAGFTYQAPTDGNGAPPDDDD